LRLLLGAVFLLACFDKILHPQAVAQTVYNYQILPDGFVNLAAMILPWLELLGACLIGGVWLPGATAVSTGLLALFIGALVYNQIRGLDIHCGCFSSENTDGPAGLWTVARDVIFLFCLGRLGFSVFFARTGTLSSSDETRRCSVWFKKFLLLHLHVAGAKLGGGRRYVR
jgi:hypothetical protein